MDWSVLLGGGLGVAVLATIQALARLVSNRRVVQATAADQITESVLKQITAANAAVDKAYERCAAAERAAEQARLDAHEARREAVDARREAMAAVGEWRRLRTEILAPYATLEYLRRLVADPGSNGSAPVTSPVGS